MGEVVDLPVIKSPDITPDSVLTAALGSGMTYAIVLGYTANGEEYFAMSAPDGAIALWLLERSKLKLLSMPENA